MKQVTIVCDGSSLGNGKGNTRAAAVAVLGFKGFWKAFGEYLGNATNQQAEIAAAYLGLKTLTEPCKVKLLSDSRYVVETMTGHFRKKTNHEWWAKLDKAASKHEIEWRWKTVFVLLSSELANACKSAVIDKGPRALERPSDHAPVVVELG